MSCDPFDMVKLAITKLLHALCKLAVYSRIQ